MSGRESRGNRLLRLQALLSAATLFSDGSRGYVMDRSKKLPSILSEKKRSKRSNRNKIAKASRKRNRR